MGNQIETITITRQRANGIVKPIQGRTLRVWEIADKMTADLGEPVSRDDLIDAAREEGIALGTVLTQFPRWKRFSGYTRKTNRSRAEAAESAQAAPVAEVADSESAQVVEDADADATTKRKRRKAEAIDAV